MTKLSQPLVSIITPSYRAVQFIAETIESVRRQDYSPIEHIVVDGGSDDGTLEILRKTPGLIWASEPDRGQSQALNKGFKMAKGEIIGWLNADDMYTLGAVSKAVKCLMADRRIAAVYSDEQIVDEQGLPIRLAKSRAFDLQALFLENYMRQPTVFMRRHVLEELGGVDENLHYSMDRELWLRMGASFKMQYIPDHTSANFRLCPGTKTFRSKPLFHLEWIGVMERSMADQRYAAVPEIIKYKAIEQARVRYGIASMEKAWGARDAGALFREWRTLVARHWAYMLKYPLKKAAQIRHVGLGCSD